MKAVLISIQPKWVEKIANKEKTIEVRKTKPSIQTPFKCYIYCTIGNGMKGDYLIPSNLQCGKVIGEFVCDWITEINPSCDIDGCVNQYIHGYPAILGENDCLSFNDMKAYLGNKKGYDWHISDLVIYDKPKELSEFYKSCDIGDKVICTNCEQRTNRVCNGRKYIKRPLQSWCYVEELQGEKK